MSSDSEITDIASATVYRMVRTLAYGGMGTVYEAVQEGVEGFEKTVAIKTILPHYIESEEFVEMFIGEAKLVANLVHPNIVQIYQLGRCDQGFYIAMEYIDGINLEEFLLRHAELECAVPIELGAFIISRICRGLEYAHNKRGHDGRHLGIVHRDVSPKNIMITSEGEVKLTDFGVAKARLYMEQDEGEVLMGKVEFMSPEQASYQVTDGRSDLFSLGIVFYELLTGKNVFEDEDVMETLHRVKTLPIPDPRTIRPEIPEDLADFIMKLLDREVKTRVQTAGEASYALEYHMYSGGYGPTIVSLAKYVQEIFPERQILTPSEEEPLGIDTALYSEYSRRSADTLRL